MAPEVSEEESSYTPCFYHWFLESLKSCVLLLVALSSLFDTLEQLLTWGSLLWRGLKGSWCRNISSVQHRWLDLLHNIHCFLQSGEVFTVKGNTELSRDIWTLAIPMSCPWWLLNHQNNIIQRPIWSHNNTINSCWNSWKSTVCRTTHYCYWWVWTNARSNKSAQFIEEVESLTTNRHCMIMLYEIAEQHFVLNCSLFSK